MATVFHSLKATLAVALLSLILRPGTLSAVCACDPDLFFQNVNETTFPVAISPVVDVNMGNSPAAFVRAAYYQITGGDAPPAFLADQVGRLTSTASTYWRRIDTVNTILNTVGPNKTRVYTDPWTTKPAFTSAPCKNVSRDVGAVLMMFFSCPGGVNCGMQWANTHTYGMNTSDPLYGPQGYLSPTANTDFFYRELMDARYAGLQFFLPNVYGPEITNGAVTNMVSALATISGTAIASQTQVGMFDDTSSWNSPYFPYAPWNSGPDMNTGGAAATNAAATKIFNNKWKPYFNAVPSQFWYRVQPSNRPLVYFYNGGTLGGLANSTAVIQATKSQFYSFFGVTPWVAVDEAFFASAGMTSTADSRFTWRTVYNAATPLSVSSKTMNGIRLDHAMVKWDTIGRDGNGSITITAKPSDPMIKGPELLNALMTSSMSANLLVLATWNDLGEGTGINRNYDYYYQGQWLPPDAFMSIIRASQSGQSCPPVGTTATNTPTISPTPTVTPTLTQVVTPSHGPLVADMENNTTNDRTLWNSGQIVSYKDAYGTTNDHSPWGPSSGTAPGCCPSNFAACFSGNLTPTSGASPYPYTFLAFDLVPNGDRNSTVAGSAFTDVQPYCPNNGISFDYKASAAGVDYIVQLNTQEVGADYRYYQFQFTPSNTGWNNLTVYFPGQPGANVFAQPPGTPNPWNPAHVGAVIFQPIPKTGVLVAYGLCIDNLTFDVLPAPTATPTASPTATQTATPSRTPTLTSTFTPSQTPSVTPSVTPTSSCTGTGTFSATLSPSPTNSPSPTYTETALGTFTETPTWTLSGTATPSSSASLTPSNSPTFTPSPSASPSSTETPVVSATPTCTGTDVLSATPTPTQTASATITPTSTCTATLLPSVVPSATSTTVGPLLPLAILDAKPVPNPQQGSPITLGVYLTAPADSLELKLFTNSLTSLGMLRSTGSFNAGWNQVAFVPAQPLASGLYFGRVVALRGVNAKGGFAKIVRLMVLP